MDLFAFQEWIDSRDYGVPSALLLLPDGEDDPDDVMAIAVEESVGSKGTVTDLIVNLYIRADHPVTAIQVGTKINTDLHMRTRTFIGNVQIILFKQNMAVPMPIGIDANNRHIFHVQFKMLVSPTDKLNVRE